MVKARSIGLVLGGVAIGVIGLTTIQIFLIRAALNPISERRFNEYG